MQTYINNPLLPAEKSIRLLHFDSNASDPILSAEMKTFGIKHAPRFIALSYAWGSPANPKSLLVNEENFDIRQNLNNALRAILVRKSNCRYQKWKFDIPMDHHEELKLKPDDYSLGDQPEWIWADAICINQGDLEEKSQQVAMMGEIYLTAERVLAWLGSGDNEALTGLQHIQSHVLPDPGSDPYFDRFNHYPSFDRYSILQRNNRYSRPSNQHTRHSPSYSSYLDQRKRIQDNKFLELEYFHRLWIVQEFALPNNLFLMYGDQTLDGNLLASFINSGQGYDDQYRTFAERVVRARLLRRGLVTLSASQPLDHLINVYAEHKCSDPRDRIFGVLGLDSGSHDVRIDYHISPIELHRQIIKITSTSTRFKGKHANPIGFIDKVYAALEIPQALRKTEDLRSALKGFEHRDFWDLQAGAVLKRWFKLCEEDNLEAVRQLDWTDVKKWQANYDLIEQRMSKNSNRDCD